MMVAVLRVWLFVVIFSTQLSHIKADVTPTISNSTGQYFFTSGHFQYDSETFTCNHSSLCYFECNHLESCTNLVLNTSSSNVNLNCNYEDSCVGDFNLSLSQNLFINCNGYSSCDGINVYVHAANGTIKGSTAYINLTNHDDHRTSYDYKNFHLQKIDVVNMQCDGRGTCDDTTLYCPSHEENACNVADYDEQYEPVLKVNEHYTLNWLNYSPEPNPQYPVLVTCIDDLGKETGSISSNIMTYNGIDVCQYYSNCCPYSSVKISNDDYKNGWYINDCIEGYDCFIDCSSRYMTTGVLSECGYRIIDGSLSNSVTVVCPEANSCDYTRVICPINGGECNVNVTIKDGSNGLRMNATSFIGNDLNINLNCLADSSCNEPYIFAQDAIGSNINMDINCVSSGTNNAAACYNLLVDGSSSDLNNISIKYHGIYNYDVVYNMNPYDHDVYTYDKLYLFGASNVNIHCNGMRACYGGMFNLENSSNIDIICDGVTIDVFDGIHGGAIDGGSCQESEFYVGGATNVNIECVSNINCLGTQIFAQESNELDVVCDGDAACSDMLISYPAMGHPQAFTLECYDGIFDYSCNGIRIYLQDDFITNFIDLMCESSKACNLIYFRCDTKGISILNPDENYHSCLSNNCCPIEANQTTASPTTASPTTASPTTTNPTTAYPTTANPTTATEQPTNTSTTSTLPQLTTTYNPGNSGARSDTSGTSTSKSFGFGIGWIVFIIVAVLFFFICAAYIAYKMGIKNGIKNKIKQKHAMIPALELVQTQNINTAQDIDTPQ